MSRIGVLPIALPSGVKVTIQDRLVRAEGPKGKLDWNMPPGVQLDIGEKEIIVKRRNEHPKTKAYHGLCRAIVQNMVKGVTDGFSKRLEINGVGFKAAIQGKDLTLNLGYSHPIHYTVPDQINLTVEENTKINIQGPSKEVVGQVAAEIRSFYPPEPYKGKGVKYAEERIVRKEGKTVQ